MTFDDGVPESDFIINPAQFVAQGVAEGLSGRSIINALQDAGAGMRTSVVYKLIGEVRAAIANRPDVQAIPTDQLPSAEQYAPWQTNRRGYSTQLTVLTRDRTTGLIGTTTTSYTTRDPHTIDEAIQNKLADWEELTDAEGSYEDQQLLGMLPNNIFAMGPDV